MAGRGFGFVFFQRHEDAEKVLELKGHHLVDQKYVE
jgi:hypothetical protein